MNKQKSIRWKKIDKETWEASSKARNEDYLIVKENGEFYVDVFLSDEKDAKKAWLNGTYCKTLQEAKDTVKNDSF